MDFKKVLKIIKKTLKNPSFLKDLYTYIKNDFLAICGIYKYENNVLFIAGLPKSGTTWVESQLAKFPGYNRRPINDPDSCTIDHNICDEVFLSLPCHKYSVLKLHTKYTEANFKTIVKHVPRFIVMIRDLRDMCVSRYFHVKNQQDHRHHNLYNSETLENGLIHCIKIIEEEYVSWVKDWINIVKKNPNSILLIKYEELNQFPKETFKKIFDFFNLPYDEPYLNKVSESKLKSEKNLKEVFESNIGLGRISTTRKGIIGDWKNYFSDKHKEKFKEIAGELLIELGYEKNLDW